MQQFKITLNHYHHRHWASSSPRTLRNSHNTFQFIANSSLSIFTNEFLTDQNHRINFLLDNLRDFWFFAFAESPDVMKMKKKSWREHNVLWTFSLSVCSPPLAFNLCFNSCYLIKTEWLTHSLNDSRFKQQNGCCGWKTLPSAAIKFKWARLKNEKILITWSRQQRRDWKMCNFKRKSERGYEGNYIKSIACELLNEFLARLEYLKIWNWSFLLSVTTKHTSLFFQTSRNLKCSENCNTK